MPGWLRNSVPLATTLLCAAAEVAAHYLSPATRFIPYPANHAGWAIVAAGVALAIASVRRLLAHRTTPLPGGQPTAMVSDGPFGLSRNPIYLPDLLVVLGVGVVFSSFLTPLAPLVFFAVVDRLIIPFEEARLREGFGTTYEDYRRRVRRWL